MLIPKKIGHLNTNARGPITDGILRNILKTKNPKIYS
jgi:hypothetical protein